MDILLRERLDRLEDEVELALGRANGLASLLIVIARHLPPEIAESCALDSREALSHLNADLVASSHSDIRLNEMQRVFSEGISIFDKAIKGGK